MSLPRRLSRADLEAWADDLGRRDAALSTREAEFDRRADVVIARLEAMQDFKNGSLIEAVQVLAAAFPTGFTLSPECVGSAHWLGKTLH